jgi:RNA polymerase sigma factor (sigma-70 family)
MAKRDISNEELIKGLCGADNNIAKYIYKNFYNKVEAFILLENGSKADAMDIFQEALMIIISRARKKKLFVTCAFSTFLVAVCKNLWIQHKIDRNKFSNILEQPDMAYEDPRDNTGNEFSMENLFHQHWKTLSRECQIILKLFYRKIPLEEIADIMGFSTVQHALNRRFRCKRALIMRIQSDPNFKKLNYELHKNY